MMILGIVDFSRALYVYHFVEHSAKTASRWAAVNGYACAQDGSCAYPTGAETSDINTYIANCELAASAQNPPQAPGTGCGATASDIQGYVANLAPMGIDASSVVTTVSWPTQSLTSTDPSPTICSGPVQNLSTAAIPNYPGCTVEVTVSYPFNFLFPLVHSASVMMSSSSEMVISH
jgi:Flp pilus assembly protein TadG